METKEPNVNNNIVDKAKEKEIDDWLPVTSSRNARWYASTFHNVTAMVGAGVLGLPYAMSQLGWGPGITVMILSWFMTLYTLWQMVEMHEMIPGKRLDRYHELGQVAFGEKLGLWIVVPQQLLVQIGTDIVYMTQTKDGYLLGFSVFHLPSQCSSRGVLQFYLFMDFLW